MRRLIVLATAATLALTADAGAQAASLSVTNDGQAGMVSSPAQAPLTVWMQNPCQAQQGTVCPAYVVAAPATPVDVAGGDTLRLSFGAPQTSVTATAGQRSSPCPGPPTARIVCPLRVVSPEPIGSLPTAATADPSVWTAALPTLTAAQIEQGSLVTVAAHGADNTDHTYTFRIASPRYSNEQTRCGRGFYNPGDVRDACTNSGGGGSPAPTPGAPTLTRSGHATLRGTRLRLGVDASQAGTVTLAIRHGSTTMLSRRLTGRAAGTQTLSATLSRTLRRRLARHRNWRYAVTATLTTSSGHGTLRVLLHYRS